MTPDEPEKSVRKQSALVLRYEVRTLDGRQLLPAGTCLEAVVMQELACRGQTQWRELSLLGYGSVRDDLQRFITSHGTYRSIFSESGVAEDAQALMAAVMLPLSVLECLSFFQDHDDYTYRHVLMVFALYSLLAYDMLEEPGATPREVAAGPLHDLGKICIPLATLKKSSPLERAERDLVEHHTVAGYVLLTYYLGRSEAFSAQVARDHHERRDGSGYPMGISQKDRQIELVAICDIYDALINPRPYRKGDFDNRSALEVITSLAEKGSVGWDPVRRLVAANRKGRPHPDACIVSPEKRGTAPAENSYGILQDGV